MPFSNLIHPQAPFKVFKMEPTSPFNRKYALKFLDLLIVRNKTQLKGTTRYLRRVYHLSGDRGNMYQIEQEVFKVAKRFSKVTGVVDPKALTLNSSPIMLALTNLFRLPLSFKLGIFTKLCLHMQIPSKKSPIRPQVSHYLLKVVRAMNHSRLLQDFSLFFTEETFIITTHFLLMLQRFSQKFSSFRSFQMYSTGSSTPDVHKLPNDLTQSITHLTIKTHHLDTFVLKPQDFPKLTYLSFMIDTHTKINLSGFFEAFETLSNLETFIFKCGENSHIEIIEFLQAFHLPKSVKNVSLTLTIDYENYFALVISQLQISESALLKLAQPKKYFLSQLIHNLRWRKRISQLKHGLHNSFEELDCFKELYDRWKGLDKLCNLTLNVSSVRKCIMLDFLLVAPILKRCKNITNLSVKCGRKKMVCQIDFDINLSVGWERIYNALETLQDTLQYLSLEVCGVNFETKSPHRLILKNIKNLDICFHATEPQYLQKIVSIMPSEEDLNARVPRKFRLSVDACVWKKMSAKQFFNGIKWIPRNLNLRLGSFIGEISADTYKKRMLDWISSAQIEGNLRLDVSGRTIDPVKLKNVLEKVRNRLITGSLSIRNYNSHKLKFQIKKERFLDDSEF